MPDPRPIGQKPVEPPQPCEQLTEAEQVGVGTYTANLLPVREQLINWMLTVALDDVEVVKITMVKK